MIPQGFEAPFVRVYYNDTELSARITNFKYIYDEEDDDTCEFVLSTDRREDVDEQWYQEKSQLKVLWGFIGGKNSETIKVYIQEVKWDFTEGNIKGRFTCTEKAVSMKFVDSNRVFKNSNFLDVAKKIADEHGVKAYIQIDADDKPNPDIVKVVPNPIETLDAYIIRRDKVFKNRIKQGDYKLSLPNDSQVFEILAKNAPARNPNADYTKLFKNHKSIPQANRTDAQFLAELARRQQQAYMVETRGDDMIIKKRNFNQKPLRSYTYGDNSGELQTFAPESKNRGRKGNAINRAFGSWDPATKTYSSGNANFDTAIKSPLLNTLIEQLKFYKSVQQRFPGGGLLGAGFSQSKNKHVFIGQNNIGAKGDNTLDHTLIDGKIRINVNNRVTALEKTLAGANEVIKNYNAQVYNSLINNPEEALDHAMNGVNASNLKKNPASAQVWGDPVLKVGKIVTILGIGKKYSGNYYIVKCSHNIDFNNGYTVDLDLVRHGANIKVNDDYIPAKQLGIQTNTQVGASGSIKTKSLKTKSN